MIGDSIRAEVFKFSRDRRLLFYSFLSVPLGFFAIRVLSLIYTRLIFRVDFGSLDMVKDAIHAFGVGQSFFAQLLFLSGAAGLLTQEYRLETWRYIVPRNRRAALLIGKLFVYACMIAFCLLLVGGTALVLDLVEIALLHYPQPELSDLESNAGRLAVCFLGSLLISLTWGSLAALVAVISRSVLGTIIIVALVALVEPFVADRISRGPATSNWLLVFPSVASSTLTRWSLNLPQIEVPDEKVVLGTTALTLWILALTLLAIAVFSLQDLSRE